MQYRNTLLDMVGLSFEAEEFATKKHSYERNPFVLEPCAREHPIDSLLKSASTSTRYSIMSFIHVPFKASELHRNCMS